MSYENLYIVVKKKSFVRETGSARQNMAVSSPKDVSVAVLRDNPVNSIFLLSVQPGLLITPPSNKIHPINDDMYVLHIFLG